MKVVAYLSGVPSSDKSSHKTEILKHFISGVNKSGDIGIEHRLRNLVACDVAIIQGWVHIDSPNTPHLNVRRQVSNNTFNKHTIIIDSNLFNYDVGKFHPEHYSRYSMDGVFPTTGNYFWDNPDPNRWKQISKDLNLALKDWRTNGNHILLACQRNGGWSMNGYSVIDWIKNTVKEIRKYSDRPIIVRGHPRDTIMKSLLLTQFNEIEISENISLYDDLDRAWCMVTYNSTSCVESTLYGTPTIVLDSSAVSTEVSQRDFTEIENFWEPDRTNWCKKIAFQQWQGSELTDGYVWGLLRSLIWN